MVDVNVSAKTAIIIVFISIAFYNFLELKVYILTTFKRRTGLYFWSFNVATWGVAFNATGYLLKHLELTTNAHLYATLILIGWCTMITGQSVVLYSRLHLVMHNRKRLRAVLIMIITNALWLHIPVIILVYGANSPNPTPFEKPYSIYEKLQLSVFFVQELIISGLYVWETTRLVKMEKTIGNGGTLQVMNHLIFVNILVVLLDFSILGLEFANLYDIQTAWKPLVYSVKLKLEFSILNRLVELTRNARSGNAYSHSRTGPRSEGVALGTLKGTGHQRSVVQGAEPPSQYEVHVGGGKGNSALQPKDSTVIKTTEFQIQSHSRRRNSKSSLAESGKEILGELATQDERGIERGSASSVSSDIRYARYENQSWQ
ncbi:integral membrane protein [Pyrenochaeta sp. MPI-SDFR-AT-0127]|nr:integral membrane protein [Pyrenochaeta sp. MPI-SDFR-AT-0127]